MSREHLYGVTVVLFVLGVSAPALAQNDECAACHAERVADLTASSHTGLACESCHGGAASHEADPDSVNPAVHFDRDISSSSIEKLSRLPDLLLYTIDKRLTSKTRLNGHDQ
jgi:hypothetical protein